jgi:hypothetical protein
MIDTTNQEEYVTKFTMTFNAILHDICRSETSEQRTNYLEELVHFIDDNQDIIDETGAESFYTNLERILIEWYMDGHHEIGDYYDIFFDQECPEWAFETECNYDSYPPNDNLDNYVNAAPAA